MTAYRGSSCRMMIGHIVLGLCLLLSLANGILFVPNSKNNIQKSRPPKQTKAASSVINRRNWLQQTTIAFVPFLLTTASVSAEEASTVTAAPSIEMKTFVDPVGYFVISIPKTFFALRRSAKGDLPDAKTGQGRRGSSIFTAGDMAKAEVVAVERFPTKVLLEENGIDATGDLTSFSSLGSPAAIAALVNLRRERDKQQSNNSKIVDAAVSEDAKVLTFSVKTEIDVQKPELLMETYGVDQLFRITRAKISLQSNDGNIMAVFASALEQDFKGPDGIALQQAVDSFTVTDQSSSSSTAG